MEALNPFFDERGLVPAIVQDFNSGRVLMLAWMNAEALQLTIQTGQAYFWSRSRQELWRKGATSGNTLEVKEVRVDCDQDAFLILAIPSGPTCHTNQTSCFYRKVIENDSLQAL
jgi:phosphoribosyl-AMP cyclohydrolase